MLTKKSIVYGPWSMVLSIFFLSFQGCATMYNPATGRKEFIVISTPEEVGMGKDIHQGIARQYKMAEDNASLERIRRIGGRLTGVCDRKDYQYHFFLIEKDELNAFTTPGGNIYVYTGLLDKLTTDDQIAAVLAHEIGHCAARHTVKKFQAALGYNIVSSIIISQIAEAQAQKITAMSTNAVMSIIFSAYSRQDEYEADRLGLKYMHLACFDPQASAQTFEILKAESKGPQPPVFLTSHPYLQDRIRMGKEEIGSLSTRYGQVSCAFKEF